MVPQSLSGKIKAIQTTSEVIAQSLKEMIYEAEFKPGQPLVQENIARMFGVSRVPVRDALQILINLGLAVAVPRRGVIVRPLSRKHLAELFAVRKILEGAALQLAAPQITEGRLKQLRELVAEQTEALKTGDVKRNEKLDDEFHRNLYGAVDNEALVEMIFTTWGRIKHARCASTVDPDHGLTWIHESIQRHQRILDALDKKDTALALRMIIANIENSCQEITACLEEMGWIEAIK